MKLSVIWKAIVDELRGFMEDSSVSSSNKESQFKIGADLRVNHMLVATSFLLEAYRHGVEDGEDISEEGLGRAKKVVETVMWDVDYEGGSYQCAARVLYDEMEKIHFCKEDWLEFKIFTKTCKQICDDQGIEVNHGTLPSYFLSAKTQKIEYSTVNIGHTQD